MVLSLYSALPIVTNMKTLSYMLVIAILGACSSPDAGHSTVKRVEALIETRPVDNDEDAADDPAIWVHPEDPDRSLVLGTNKKGGLEVYDLRGNRLQILPTGRLNNVDIRQHVMLEGELVDLAVATNRTTRTLDVFRINSKDASVEFLEDKRVFLDLDAPYGVCLYQPSESSELHAFVNDKDGRYQQWRINEESVLLGEFMLSSQPEGCVADDDKAVLYVGEENQGLWRISLKKADVEGITLYKSSSDTGYLLVSSQGDNSYAVYEREEGNRYVGSFHIVDNGLKTIDGSSETDGIAVSGSLITTMFPEGLLVVQDGENTRPRQNQNFKYVSWKDIRLALELKN